MSNPARVGWLDKQSRYLKTWKKRWVILTRDAYLLTFSSDIDLSSPTEIIDLRVNNSVKSSSDYTNKSFSFDVYSPDICFSFYASTDSEKEDWIRAIGRAIVIVKNKKFIRDDGSEYD